MDDEKRNLYDETGEIDDSLDIDLQSTYEYFKNVYPTITKNDIESFSKKYPGSDMERDDLINYYNENSGDLTKLLEWIPLSTNNDKQRYLDIFEELIEQKFIKKTKKYTTTKNKIKDIKEDNEEEVREQQSKLDDLSTMIMKRQRDRTEYFDRLSKYLNYL
jgi:DnaJ family protein C protein 9